VKPLVNGARGKRYICKAGDPRHDARETSVSPGRQASFIEQADFTGSIFSPPTASPAGKRQRDYVAACFAAAIAGIWQKEWPFAAGGFSRGAVIRTEHSERRASRIRPRRYLAAPGKHDRAVIDLGTTGHGAMNLASRPTPQPPRPGMLRRPRGSAPGPTADSGMGRGIESALPELTALDGRIPIQATLEGGGGGLPLGVGGPSSRFGPFELTITAISALPSYPAVLERVIGSFTDLRAARDLDSPSIFGGESGWTIPDFAAASKRPGGHGAQPNYGVTAVFHPRAERVDTRSFHALEVLHSRGIDPRPGPFALRGREGRVGADPV